MLENFICPACKAENKMSEVDFWENDVGSSIEESRQFYDRFGRLHVHEPNPLWYQWECTNGHRGSIFPCTHCGNCEWGEHGHIHVFSGAPGGGVLAEYNLDGTAKQEETATACVQ